MYTRETGGGGVPTRNMDNEEDRRRRKIKKRKKSRMAVKVKYKGKKLHDREKGVAMKGKKEQKIEEKKLA